MANAGIIELSAADIVELKASFAFDSLRAIDRRMLENIGRMNSSTYRKKLLRIMNAAHLTPNEKTIVVALSVQVRSKRRICDSLRVFSDVTVYPWYTRVNAFFNGSCVDYTNQETPLLTSVAHISNALPSIAAICWAIMAEDADATTDKMVENLWFAQLRVNTALLNASKTWEKHFWENVVTRSRNPNQTGFAQFGQTFQEDFWKTKAADRYQLLDKNLDEVPPAAATGYTPAEVTAWIAHIRS